MSGGGSQQLRIFRLCLRAGATLEDSAIAAEISIGEARMHAADDAKNPPPPEAYILLKGTPTCLNTNRVSGYYSDDQ